MTINWGVAVTYLENVVRLFYGIGALVLLKGVMPEVKFANLAYFMAMSLVVYGVCKFSLDAYTIKELVKNNSLRLLLKIIKIRFLGSLIIISFLYLALYFLKVEMSFFMLVVFQMFRSVDSYDWYLRSLGILKFQALLKIMAMSISVLLIFLVIELDLEYSWFAYCFLVEWLVVSVVYVFLLVKMKAFSSNEEVDFLLVKVLKGSLWVYIGYLLFLFYSKYDQFYLKAYVEDGFYGDYMLALRLSEASLILVMSLNLYLYPKLVLAYENSVLEFYGIIRKYSLIFFLISFLVVVFVWVFRLSYSILGDYLFIGYETLKILSIVVFSLIPNFYFGLRSSYYTIINEPKNIVLGGALGSVFAIFIGVPSITFFGGYGAMISVILVGLISLGLSNIFTVSGRQYLRVLLYAK